MPSVSVLASPADKASPDSRAVARLWNAIERQLARAANADRHDPATRQAAHKVIGRLRDALAARGYAFDEAAQLRLYFLDWSAVTRQRATARRTQMLAGRRALRERASHLARCQPAPGLDVWQAVAGVRLELIGKGVCCGEEVLRLHAMLVRAAPTMPYLASTPSASGLALAQDPAPAWVMSVGLPVPDGVWAKLRDVIDRHALQVRAWDYRDPASGRGLSPVCADVSDLFRPDVVTALSVATEPTQIPHVLRPAE